MRLSTCSMLLGASSFLMSVAFGDCAYAQIQVKINGTPIACPTASCDSAFPLRDQDIPLGAGFSFADLGGTAQVIAGNDAADDSLTLQNLKITSTSAGATGSIELWRQFDSPPTANGTSYVRYDRSSGGKILRTVTQAALNSTVTVTGYINGDEIDVSQTKQVMCTPAVCGVFSLNKSEYWYYLEGARELRAKIEFEFTNIGDYIELGGSVNHKLSVKNATGAIADDEAMRAMGVREGKDRLHMGRNCRTNSHGVSCKPSGLPFIPKPPVFDEGLGERPPR